MDERFKRSYTEEKTPSPSLFVYTLPNILIGEIAIRNKWYGENLFTLSQKFDADYFSNQCKVFMNGKTKACLCGWIEATNANTDVFLFFVEENNTETGTPLTEKTLNELYK